MKSVVLFALVGAGLFSGTVTGLLAFQGRLNFEGTRGIPVVESLFSEPEKPEGEEHLETMPHANSADLEDAAHAQPYPAEDNPRIDGLGREEPLPREPGPMVARDEGEASAPPVGRTEPSETEHGDESSTHAGDSESVPLAQKAESLMGQDQYRRGKLFSFPRLESGLSVSELDAMVASAQELKKTLDRTRAALEQREADLSAREADLQDREAAVLEKMRDVLQQRTQLEEEISSFQDSYTLVRSNEVEQFELWATTLAGQDATKSSEIIMELWNTEEGRAKAVKILKVMSTEARDEIFAVLTAEQTREILDRLTRAVMEGEQK